MLGEDGSLIWERSGEGQGRAGEITLNLMREADRFAQERKLRIEGYVVDIGPGSWTGMRVGITIAKSLAYAQGRKIAGITAFDLIADGRRSAVSSRKGEWVCRDESGVVSTSAAKPEGCAGWGRGDDNSQYPSFDHAADWWSRKQDSTPVDLVPEYFGSPAISTPKKPYANAKEAPGGIG